MDALDEAEEYLDRIAETAAREARKQARSPERLLELIAYTRELSHSE